MSAAAKHKAELLAAVVKQPKPGQMLAAMELRLPYKLMPSLVLVDMDALSAQGRAFINAARIRQNLNATQSLPRHASSDRSTAGTFCMGVSDEALQFMLDAGNPLPVLLDTYAQMDADNARLRAALSRTADHLARLLAAQQAGAALTTTWHDELDAALGRT